MVTVFARKTDQDRFNRTRAIVEKSDKIGIENQDYRIFQTELAYCESVTRIAKLFSDEESDVIDLQDRIWIDRVREYSTTKQPG